MIRYTLICDAEHGFEVWFASAGAYDTQAKARSIVCPICGSHLVRKAPMAPAVVKRRGEQKGSTNVSASGGRKQTYAVLKELRDHVTANADYVGPQFPEEARKIHFEEAPARSIYGEATSEEAKDLHEEGIPVWPLPRLPEEHN